MTKKLRLTVTVDIDFDLNHYAGLSSIKTIEDACKFQNGYTHIDDVLDKLTNESKIEFTVIES